MDHVLGPGAVQVAPGHVEEVVFRLQYAGAGIVDVEKTLQVGEGIGRAQLLYGFVAELDTVSSGQLEDQFRLQRPFDVDMQFRLWHAAQDGFQFLPRDRFEVHGVLRFIKCNAFWQRGAGIVPQEHENDNALLSCHNYKLYYNLFSTICDSKNSLLSIIVIQKTFASASTLREFLCIPKL